MQVKKTQLAELLLNNNLINREQMNTAIALQAKSDKKIGQILVDLGYIDEIKLMQLLSQQLNIPFIDLKEYHLTPELVRKLPEFYARHFRAIILKQTTDGFLVGMADPQNILAHDEIERILKYNISLAIIREDELLPIIDTIYRRSEEISHFAESLSAEMKPSDTSIFSDTQDLTSEDMPVVNLLRSIFEDAVQIGASDIHIEPGLSVLRIRLRVDGVLQEQIIDEKSIAPALIQRIKLMSGLNIAENRLPQDGRFTINVKSKTFDIRVSTIPVQYGEAVVMRLLDQSGDLLKLDQIGMPEAIFQYYQHVLKASYGLLLIVGPTGSGKTTTLYASLNELNSPEDNIITVEDPIEYRLARINQVQVNSKIGLTFASVLRSILRQDPDIIMIGEMRDHETMEIALRSAMTGHFVLATLHTNDTISSVTRLLDMGAEGYLLASVLRAVIAQRLVRRICDKCITDQTLSTSETTWLNAMDNGKYAEHNFKYGVGCTYCHDTGYHGRIGVYELLPITANLADAIRKQDISAISRIAEKEPLFKSLVKSGLDLALQGITTISEVIRMSGEI